MNGNHSSQLFPHHDQRSNLRAIEFSANITNSARNESVGKALIIMNRRTLRLVEYFYCKVYGDGFIVKRSRYAYISIVYPECTPNPYQQTTPPPEDLGTSQVEPTPSQTYTRYHRVISKSAIIQEPCKQELIGTYWHDNVFVWCWLLTYGHYYYYS